MNELLSVIIPVYNASKTIDRCVESVLNSTCSNFEILIIDDGSEAETAEACDRLALRDTRIKVFHQKNGGVSKARNNGIENAMGEFITFVDADDTVDSDLLMTAVNVMLKNRADIVMTGHRECYDDGSYKKCFCNGKTTVKRGAEVLTEFFTTNNIGWTVWAKFYTRGAIGNVRFQEGKRIAEDMYFNYEVLKRAETIVEYGFPKYNYIKQDESAMAGGDCLRFFDSFCLTKTVFDDSETDEDYRKEKTFFYIKSSLFFFRMIYVKDKDKSAKKDIEKARKLFLDSIKGETAELSMRMKLELILLRDAEPLYRQQAKIYWLTARKNVKF